MKIRNLGQPKLLDRPINIGKKQEKTNQEELDPNEREKEEYPRDQIGGALLHDKSCSNGKKLIKIVKKNKLIIANTFIPKQERGGWHTFKQEKGRNGGPRPLQLFILGSWVFPRAAPRTPQCFPSRGAWHFLMGPLHMPHKLETHVWACPG